MMARLFFVGFVGLIFMLVLGIVKIEQPSLIYGQSQNSINDTTVNPVIDGISCDPQEHFTIHIHSKLDININNKSYLIPAKIGIVPQKCIYWLHTHDESGIIHIESPKNKSFTLGQFFRIWNAFDNSIFVKNLVNNYLNGTVDIIINGNNHNVSKLDYRELVLKDGMQISLYINTNLQTPTKTRLY